MKKLTLRDLLAPAFDSTYVEEETCTHEYNPEFGNNCLYCGQEMPEGDAQDVDQAV